MRSVRIAVSPLLLLTIAQGMLISLSCSRSRLGPGNGRTWPIWCAKDRASACCTLRDSSGPRSRPFSRLRALTKCAPLIPIRRWMRQTESSIPTKAVPPAPPYGGRRRADPCELQRMPVPGQDGLGADANLDVAQHEAGGVAPEDHVREPSLSRGSEPAAPLAPIVEWRKPASLSPDTSLDVGAGRELQPRRCQHGVALGRHHLDRVDPLPPPAMHFARLSRCPIQPCRPPSARRASTRPGRRRTSRRR